MAPHDKPLTDKQAPVPMLDITRQNTPLQGEINSAMAEVCRTGSFVHGPACKTAEASIADYCQVKHAIGCASGSDALLLALMALGIGPGDEVILPSFTFFATAGSVWRLGATPVFSEIRPDTFNIDADDVAAKITSATKAILPVHLFGQCVDMDSLSEIAGDVPIIEDAAQAIGAEYHGRRTGSLGTIGCFSFYPTKNLGGFGDGGMLTTDDEELASKLATLRDHGQRPRYYHSVVGMNSRLDAIQAAVLNVKLPRLDDWAARRQRNADHYEGEFSRLGLTDHVILPAEAAGCTSVWNQFTIRVGDGDRDRLQQHLQEQRIGSAVYYPVPLHRQDCFAALGYEAGSLPVSEQASEEVISLPVFPELARREQDRVIATVAEFFGIEYFCATTSGGQAA